jgi:hypothetical protein
MAGSKMDIPKDLLEQIQYLEELFTVDTKKLKEISNHFVSELAKGGFVMSSSFFWGSSRETDAASGLSVEGGSIVGLSDLR